MWLLPLLAVAAATDCELRGEPGRCDGRGDDTRLLQTALDACAGTELRLLQGAVCVSGPLTLPGNSRLLLEQGAVLRAERRLWPWNLRHRQPAPFLKAANITNVSILGKGTIDGQGRQWWRFFRTLTQRPWSLFFDGCSDVLLEDFTLLDPPCWSINLGGERFRVQGINITGPDWITAPNTDGISVSAKHVWISGVDITNGDDSIVMKDQAQDVLVENSVVRQGNGLVIGTSDNVDIHNITFRNCTAADTTFGCHLKFKKSQSGSVSNVTFEDIKIYQSKAREQRRVRHGDWAGYAIGVHMNDQGAVAPDAVSAAMTTVRLSNVTFRRIAADVLHAGEFRCNGGALACRGLRLEHVHLNASESGCVFTGAFGSSADVAPTTCAPPSELTLV